MPSSPAAPRGLQRPRVSSHPPYTASYGQEAVDLAALAGLKLDPWQAHVLDVALAHDLAGHHLSFEVGLIVARQNGKGSILEARELWGLFLGRERLILHSAHEYKTAQEAFLRIKSLVDNTDALRARVKAVRTANGEQGIELTNGNRLRFVARSKGSGRGFTGDCIILDEAYELNAEQMAALLPTLSSRPNPQLWYTSSAGMTTSVQLNAVRERGLAGADPSLAYLEWSAPRGADLDSRHAWAQANPALGYRISETFVERERRAMPDEEFARERLSVWSDARNESIVPAETWEALADPASEMHGQVVFAVDVTPDRSSASIGVAGYRPDGLQHLELVDHQDGTRWVARRLAQLQLAWNARTVVLDPGGPAGSLIPELEAADVPVTLISSRELGQACGAFYDAAVDPDRPLRHLGQKPLDGALLGARKRPLGDAWAFARKGDTDISPLYAVTLAKHGLDATPDTDITHSVW